MKTRMTLGSLAGACLAIEAMVACSGGSPAVSEPPSGHAEPPAGTATLASSFSPDGVQHLSGHLLPEVVNAPMVDRLAPSEAMSLLVALPVKDPAALKTATEQVSDPKSPSFRKYLKPTEFGERYGASPDDYQKLVAWATSKNYINLVAQSGRRRTRFRVIIDMRVIALD